RRRELVVALEHRAVGRRHPDVHAGAVREIGDAADVVVVAVRDEDAGAPRSHPRELEAKRGGVGAGVDHDRFRRTALGTDDVAVRLDRTQLVAIDDERHRRTSLSGADKLAPVRSWNLTELDAPAGTRDPIVLETADGTRAVMLAIAPGQELREHEVKARAWVTVVEGRGGLAS